MAKGCDFDKKAVGPHKAVEVAGLTQDQVDQLAELNRQGLADVSGIGGEKMIEPVCERLPAGCEQIMGSSGRYIVFGRDRPASNHPADSGYGNVGHTKAAMIDLYVGPTSAKKYILETTPDGEKYKVNPCFFTDAARVYISQKCDIDSYFGLDGDSRGVRDAVGKSAVALKADGIRIIAREGVKIISGADSHQSRGAKNNKFQGIDLIGGNNVGPGYELEPLVKGNALIKTLKGLYGAISAVVGICANLALAQTELAASYGMHVHPPGGPSPNAVPASIKAILDGTTIVTVGCVGMKQNLAFAEISKLASFSSGQILSRCNKTN